MSTSGDVPAPAVVSPVSKVKFLCSHGGRILPRPADGHLKYVGGETRVISVLRNITFTDLMKKLSSLIEGDVILKYRLIPEELDALVTVKSDEDLRHMFEEYDRQELIGTPRLRTFLFPASPIIVENPMGPMDRYSLEQRYINSVNGIIVNPIPMYNRNFRPPTVNTSQTSFTISSACSSPRTPSENAIPTVAADVTSPELGGFRKGGAMPRARSSPNLCSLGASSPNLGLMTNQQYPYHRQPPPPHHYLLQPYPKPPLDPSPHKNSGPDHFMRVRPTNHSPNSCRSAHLGYQKGSPYDEYHAYNRYDRESPPGSR
ncbi:putative PB1 domain-containing protein [Helianthus anomalus]